MCNEMKPWEPYLPEHVCLYYVDYNSNLDGNTKNLQKCIEDNNLYPISESIDGWWGDSFDSDVLSFTNYNCCPELGKYPIFFRVIK